MMRKASGLAGFAKRAICSLCAVLLAASAAAVAVPGSTESAFAAGSSIYAVDEDSFAPEGYDWYMEFTGVEVVSGWEYVEDLNDGYIGDRFAPDIVSDSSQSGARSNSGYIAKISSDPTGNEDFTLKLTGGTYGDTPIDAIVKISDWDYWGGTAEMPLGSVGSEDLGWWSSSTKGYYGLYPGGAIIYNPNWTSDSTIKASGESPTVLNNLNFFSIGMTEFTVEVYFVEAGTSNPVQVMGHMTCSDLDSDQTFAFGGGVKRAEIISAAAEECPSVSTWAEATGNTAWINLHEGGTVALGAGGVAEDDSDGNYQKGLVATYFDTGAKGTNAIELTFGTPYGRQPSADQLNYETMNAAQTISGGDYWSESEQKWYYMSPVGFFSMTPEYIANPAKTEGGGAEIMKEVLTNSPVAAGDEIDWRITATLPQEGVDVRVGYRLDNLEITDYLSELHAYKRGSAELTMDGGAVPSSAYTIDSYQQADGNWALKVEFTADFLKDLECEGQVIELSFTTIARDYPSDWDYTRVEIPNNAELYIVGDVLVSNTVYNEMISPEKTINGGTDVVQGVGIGDTVTYAIKQQVHNVDHDHLTKYDNLSYTDELPEYVRYVDGSYKVYDSWGNVLDESAGTFSYDEASNTVSFEFADAYLQKELADGGMIYDGREYVFEWQVEVVDQPADDELTVDNFGYVTANTVTEKTNVVSYEPVSPVMQTEKHAVLDHQLASVINGFEYLSHDQNPEKFSTVHYEGTFKNTADKTRAKNVTFTDELPAGFDLIEGSVKASGADGIQIDESGNVITITVPELDPWVEITYEYDCYTTDEGNGKEIVNTAHVWATNVDLGLEGAENNHATDDGEVYVNDPTVVVSKHVSESAVQNDDYQGTDAQAREEYRVGDEITYTVTATNTTPGTFARNFMLSDTDMPAGMELVGEVKVTGLGADGKWTQIAYPIAGESDSAHDEVETRDIKWKLDMVEDTAAGTWGWELNVDYLAYDYPVTVTWTVKPTSEVNGWEIYNQAKAVAENQPSDTFLSETPCVWINTPEFDIDKYVSKTDSSYQVGDVAQYNVELFDLKTPGTLARQTTLSDMFVTEGTDIIEDSFVITDRAEQATDMAESVELNRYVDDQSWHIDMTQVYGDETGYWVNEENYFVWADGVLTEQAAQNPVGATEHSYFKVFYEASINDMALQNLFVVNDATATSLEGFPVTDTSEVTVIGAALNINKTSNDGDSFEVGDVAEYELTVTNMATDTVAEDVQITDALSTEKAGTAIIIDGTIRLYDEKNQPISGWTVEYANNEAGDHIGFAVDTNYDLSNSGKITVRYDVKYLADNGSEAVLNTATASAANAPEVVDTYEAWLSAGGEALYDKTGDGTAGLLLGLSFVAAAATVIIGVACYRSKLSMPRAIGRFFAGR